MANVSPVLKATAALVHEIHTTQEDVPIEISQLADQVEMALTEYQYAVDYAQEKRTNYRVRGKRR